MPSPSRRSRAPWWQRGVIYQIYPRSFQDTTGNGVGDLPGVIQRLDYLAWLGIDALWLSPFYPSPMADFGYDIADYTDVDPLFGTLADFDRLVTAAHERGLQVIVDFVPNHTSDQHPWFQESRSSRDNPKRDWYLWADPAPDGGPPNNWRGTFGGSAWTFDEATGQCYYHAFLPEQPDLNWRNPEVREAMHDILRFWLDRGVDGFRVDVIWHVIKDTELRDNPPAPGADPRQRPHHEIVPIYTTDRPEAHEVARGLRRVVESHDDRRAVDSDADRVLIGEIYLPAERLVTYYGDHLDECHLPYNFQLLEMAWSALAIRRAVERYEALLPEGAWPNWVLSNHDRHRVATRVGPDLARAAAMLLLTLRGTPTIYYGDELGMENVPIPPELVQDPYEKNIPGVGLGRDPERTPMQWDGSARAGFTTGEPWLPLAPDANERHVARQQDDPGSMLTLHRRLLALRRGEPALSVGSYATFTPPESAPGDDAPPASTQVLAYVREYDESRFLVALNLSPEAATLPLGELQGTVALTTDLAPPSDDTAAPCEGALIAGSLRLRAGQGVIVRLTPGS